MNLKFLNKKVSLGIFLAGLFGASAIVYSLGYKMAMDRFNDVVSYVQEKQKMYSSLSELDHNVRSDYVSDISEPELLDSICKGYINGLGDSSSSFWNKNEYKEYQEAEKKLKPKIEYKVVKDDVAYIKCDKFINNASKDVIEKIDSTVVSGINNLIFDLRNCEKSSDEEIFKILQHVIPEGDIVNAVDNKNNKEVVCKSTSSGVTLNFIVLTNEKTSGGAEVLASALKDSKDAKIIGAKTAGIPTRAKKVTFSDESVAIFADAYYITQSGNSIFKKGLEPDISVENVDNEDAQLQRAIDMAGKIENQ